VLRREIRMRSLRTGPASGIREVHARLLDFGLRRARRLEVHDFCRWCSLAGCRQSGFVRDSEINANPRLTHAQELLLQEACIMLIDPWNTIFHSSGVMNLLTKQIRRRRMFTAPKFRLLVLKGSIVVACHHIQSALHLKLRLGWAITWTNRSRSAKVFSH
jgi:hypothetical protein